MCSGRAAEADGLQLTRGGLLTTVNTILSSGKSAWIKRALRLVRHLLQSDTSGELSLKVARMSSQELVHQWSLLIGRSTTAVDMDVLSFLLWTYQRLSRFVLFQREIANSPEFLPLVVTWLSERFPPSTVASDALWEVLANVAELGTPTDSVRVPKAIAVC